MENSTFVIRACDVVVHSSHSPPVPPGRHRHSRTWPVGISHVTATLDNRVFVASGRQWDVRTKTTNYAPSDVAWLGQVYELETRPTRSPPAPVDPALIWWARYFRSRYSRSVATPPSSSPRLRMAWFRVQTSGDCPWELHDACAARVGERVFLFGGQSRYLFKYNDDLKIYDPRRAKWTTVSPKSLKPAGRQQMACAANVTGEGFVVFGGWRSEAKPNDSLIGGEWRGSFTNQMISYSLRTNEWRDVVVQGPIPSPRSDFAHAAHGRQLFIHGGFDGRRLLDELWRFDLLELKWERILVEEGPSPRRGHTLSAFQPFSSSSSSSSSTSPLLILVGGSDSSFHLLADVWTYDIRRHHWRRQKNIPDNLGGGRSNHEASVVSVGGRDTVAVIGGNVVEKPFHPKWVLLLQTRCQDSQL